MISEKFLEDIAENGYIVTNKEFMKELASELLNYRKADRKIDILMDSTWIAGAKFGWNCGVNNDNETFQESIKGCIRERVELKEEIKSD